jgi:N-acetylmuramic acid 6-phosphate (MurNAc-6-P) etherase
MRFKIGLDGSQHRPLGKGDSAIAILAGDTESIDAGFYRVQMDAAEKTGAHTGMIRFHTRHAPRTARVVSSAAVTVPVPETDFLLDGVTRVAVKMVLNALSTCTMVRLGRVMGNYMIWVVASNLKLIDRATRYIQKLTGLAYDDANRLLFEVVEYIEPRMKADQAYPPVVGMAVLRARHKLTNEQAEERLKTEIS